MITEITLRGTTDYHPKYPPENAKKGYVARITGRVHGPTKYKREFLGSEVTILPGDEGLYERQRGDRKGGATRWYHVILSHPEHGLIISTDCEDELPKIAKLLDEGVSIEDAVEVTDLRPSEKYEGRMIFTAIARNKVAAEQAAAASTMNEAETRCWEILRGLPAEQARKVLTALHNRFAT